ncbi:MAG: hypothetical protein AAFX06_34400, partial [Planctomycetota bacterium]
MLLLTTNSAAVRRPESEKSTAATPWQQSVDDRRRAAVPPAIRGFLSARCPARSALWLAESSAIVRHHEQGTKDPLAVESRSRKTEDERRAATTSEPPGL